MQVLWFATEQECADAVDMINANFRTGATLQGYDLDEFGNIIGKDNTGQDRPDAQVTTTWDTPHYDTQTDAWWVLDPAERFPPDVVERLMLGVIGSQQGEYTYPPDPEE